MAEEFSDSFSIVPLIFSIAITEAARPQTEFKMLYAERGCETTDVIKGLLMPHFRSSSRRSSLREHRMKRPTPTRRSTWLALNVLVPPLWILKR
jgi:hypothetical protein